MDLQKLYSYNKGTILGSEINFINSLQEKLIKNFDLDSKKINHNESIKHIDKKIISNLNYFIKDSDPIIKSDNSSNEENSSIVIQNGRDYYLNNINKDDFFFSLLFNDENLLVNKIRHHNEYFKNDYIVNLNSIFLNSSFNCKLNSKKKLKLVLSHKNDHEKSTIYSKNFITVEKDSKLILIEKFEDKISSDSNIINYFDLKPGAQVTHLVIQNNAEDSNLLLTSHVNCNKNSNFKQFIFNSSKGFIRNHHYADLIGENANVNLSGVFLASNKQIVDNKTVANHLNPNCKSNQVYKAILSDQAKGNYLSNTYVNRLAQKTEAYQLSKGIILSDEAIFHSKPELKIFADDVKCSHGSTIGPFDDDIVFYLRTRGLDLKTIKSLLIKSFYSDMLVDINESLFLEDINKLVNEWININIS